MTCPTEITSDLFDEVQSSAGGVYLFIAYRAEIAIFVTGQIAIESLVETINLSEAQVDEIYRIKKEIRQYE
jgi:hypothetical protein